jgi:YidC/Oxa1 family membrane protein insertase
MIRNNPQMEMDETADLLKRLSETDILITDRSGIALEFALGCRRPVIFIETALKEAHKEWRKWGMEPLENAIRSQIGLVVHPEDLSKIPSLIDNTYQSKESFAAKMDTLKREHFYNSPAAYQEGVKYILDKLNTQ